MKMSNYYLSWISFYTLFHFCLSIVWVLITKWKLAPNSNLILFWLLYFLTGFYFIALGMFITGFFVKAKPGVLCAIIFFFILFGTEIAMRSFDTQTVGRNTLFALSPIAGLSKAASILLLVESNNQSFGFSLWDTPILNFTYGRWFWITLIESIVLIVLGIYVDQVWPKETGVRKHPLFCFMKRKKKANKVVFLFNIVIGRKKWEESVRSSK